MTLPLTDKQKAEKMADKILANMDDTQKKLTKPMLENYIWYTLNIAKLQKEIEKTGTHIEKELGAKGNRRTTIIENPAVKTLCRYTTQAANYYTKLMANLSKAEQEKVDELADFLDS